MMFIDHKKPLETFDKIEFNKVDDVKNLLAWRDNNRDLVRNFNFVLEKGYIHSTYNDVYIIFEKNDNYVYFDMLMKKDGILQHFQTFKWFYHKKTIQPIHPNKEKFEDETFSENTKSMITIFATLMAFMEHFKENKNVLKKHSITQSKTKKKKNGKKKIVKKIGKVIYNINIEDQERTKEKREYHMDLNNLWTVRGHWRNLPNGNKVWIKPYKKGNKKEEEQPTTYKF